jgi:hypothetical protein
MHVEWPFSVLNAVQKELGGGYRDVVQLQYNNIPIATRVRIAHCQKWLDSSCTPAEPRSAKRPLEHAQGCHGGNKMHCNPMLVKPSVWPPLPNDGRDGTLKTCTGSPFVNHVLFCLDSKGADFTILFRKVYQQYTLDSLATAWEIHRIPVLGPAR